MASDLFSLNANPEQDDLLHLRTGMDTNTVSEPTAESRATKADLGAGELSPGKDVIKASIMDGNEGHMRLSLAQQSALRDFKNNQIKAREIASIAGGPITDEEVARVQQLMTPPIYDPSSFFEQSYANEMVSRAAYLQDSQIQASFADAPKPTLEALGVHSNHIANREYVNTQLENYKDTLNNSDYYTPITPQGVDVNGVGKVNLFGNVFLSPSVAFKSTEFIPGKATLEWNSVLKMINPDASIDLPGGAKEQIALAMYSLPHDQFKQKFDEVFGKLKEIDPEGALQFGELLKKYSTTDKAFDNIMAVVQGAATGLPVAPRAVQLLKNVSKGASEIPPKAENILAESGRVVEGATIAASKFIRNPQREQENLEELYKWLPSLGKPEGILDNIGTQKREDMVRIIEMANRDKALLNDIMTHTASIDRITKESLLTGEAQMQARLQAEYPKISDSAFDMTILPIRDPYNNTYLFEVRFGYTGGAPFKGKDGGEQAARNAAEWMGFKEGEYKIVPNGNSSYISIIKPLRETDTATQAALIETINNIQGYNWLSRYIFGLNRADYNLSKFNQQARLLATYAPSRMRQAIYEMGQPIRDLSRAERRDLQAVWRDNSSMTSPKDGNRGYFYETPAEVEDGFRRLGLNAPTAKQISAYFAYTRMYDVDLYLRNMALTMAKSRLGVERVRFNLKGTGRWGRDRTDYIDGRIETTLPETKEDSTLLYITKGQKRGEGKLFNVNDIKEDRAGKIGKEIKARLERGEIKLAQLHSPRSGPLSETLGENQYVNFVASDAIETAPLTYNHLPRRPGGHIANEFPVYLKQANFSKSSINKTYRLNYLGDKTIVGMDNAAQAAKFGPRFQQANLLYRQNKMDELKTYVENNLPVPFEQFKSWYEPRFENGKKIPPFLDPNEDIHVVPSGKSVLDVDSSIQDPTNKKYRGFVNAAESPHDLSRNINVGFTGERSDVLYAIKEKSTIFGDIKDGFNRALGRDVAEPAWNWEPAAVVDPIPILGRALGQAINSRWLNDYQHLSIESWMAQHASMLDVAPNRLRNNPYYYFHNADAYWQKGLTGEQADQLAMAKTARYQMRQFMGYRGKWGREYDAAMQRLVDGIYNKLGPRTSELVADALPYMKNSDQYLRTIAFKTTLGFWNLPQFFVQMNTFAHTAAVAGASNAFPAVPAAYYSSVLRYTRDPSVIAGIDKKLVELTKNLPAKYRWKPGQFTESHNELWETGFQNVGGEVQQLDRFVDPTIYQSTLGRVIDSGDFFFKEGERHARLAAWHSAYREFRQKTPSHPMTIEDRNAILQRADDLNVNMSRASNSALNSGLLSTTTQFYSYAHSFASQIWGNKLTKAEKFRTLAVQSALYGLPLGLSATGLPVYESIRSKAQELGYGDTINTDPLVSTMMNGFIQAGINWATGVNPNIGGKFGNSGMSPVRDLLAGDKEWWQILTGVSGTAVGNIIGASDPVAQWAMNMFRDDNKQFPFKWQDVVQMAREVSTFNIAYRGIYGFETGLWLSKKNIPIVREDPNAALAMSFFGVQPQGVSDTYLMGQSMKKQKQAWLDARQHIVDDIRKAAIAYQNDDPDTGNDYMKRAQTRRTVAGIPFDQVPQILSEANKGYMTLMDRVAPKFPKFGGTVEERTSRTQQLIQQQERNQ